jgi:hypothetical protein
MVLSPHGRIFLDVMKCKKDIQSCNVESIFYRRTANISLLHSDGEYRQLCGNRSRDKKKFSTLLGLETTEKAD